MANLVFVHSVGACSHIGEVVIPIPGSVTAHKSFGSEFHADRLEDLKARSPFTSHLLFELFLLTCPDCIVCRRNTISGSKDVFPRILVLI